MIDPTDMGFIVDVQNDIQTTVKDLAESHINTIKDEIADAISMKCSSAAGDVVQELMQKYPFMTENATSEDIMWEELQNQIEDAVYNNIRY